MKIAITGVTGLRNRGVEALVQPLIKGLQKTFPGTALTIFSGSPEYDRLKISDPSVTVVPEGALSPRWTRAQRVLQKFGVKFARCYPRWERLQEADLLVVTGGDVFSSEYGDQSFERHLIPMRLAHEHQVPFVIFAQSIGPFTNEKHRDSWLAVCQHAAHISVREKRTHDYLVDELKIDPGKVSITADPAFLLEPSQETVQLGKRLRQGDRPLIGISISQGLSDWTGVGRDQRLTAWELVLSRITGELKAHVLLVPHVQESYADDSIACHELWRRSGFSSNLTVLGGDFTASEFKGVLSQCDMVIAERMHAGIGGLSSMVCTALVAYSVKARGILDEMVGPELSRDCALIEGGLFTDPEAVCQQVKAVWDKRHEIKEKLQITVPQAKEKATVSFQRLAASIS